MNLVPVADFIPTLRALVNVPIPAIMGSALVKSAQVFCRKSGVAVMDKAFPEVVQNTHYSILTDASGEPEYQDLQASEIKQITAVNTYDNGRYLLESGYDYTVKSRDVVVFHGEYQSVEITFSVEPTQQATHLPSVLYTDYLDGVASGAAARLLAQPDSDWSDGSLSTYHDTIFTEAMVDARRFALDSSPDLSFSNPIRKRDFI